MKLKNLTIPEAMIIGGTRAALGAGVGLLISGKLSRDQRNAAGWVLFGLGVISTIPIVLNILGKGPFAESVA